jgi:hypothetical protein
LEQKEALEKATSDLATAKEEIERLTTGHEMGEQGLKIYCRLEALQVELTKLSEHSFLQKDVLLLAVQRILCISKHVGPYLTPNPECPCEFCNNEAIRKEGPHKPDGGDTQVVDASDLNKDVVAVAESISDLKKEVAAVAESIRSGGQ